MATDTGEILAAEFGVDLMHDLGMAFSAGILGDLLVPRGDFDRIFEVTGRECDGMVPAVETFGEVLRNQTRRRMTVVANRHRVMAGFRPRFEMIFHHVAIHAGFRIIAQIGVPVREKKRVGAQTDEQRTKKQCRGLEKKFAHLTI